MLESDGSSVECLPAILCHWGLERVNYVRLRNMLVPYPSKFNERLAYKMMGKPSTSALELHFAVA